MNLLLGRKCPFLFLLVFPVSTWMYFCVSKHVGAEIIQKEREKKRNATYFFTPVMLRAVAEKHNSKNPWPWHCANYFTIRKGLSSNVLIVPVKCFSSISNSIKPEVWYLSLSSTHFYTLLTSTSLQIKVAIEYACLRINTIIYVQNTIQVSKYLKTFISTRNMWVQYRNS